MLLRLKHNEMLKELHSGRMVYTDSLYHYCKLFKYILQADSTECDFYVILDKTIVV